MDTGERYLLKVRLRRSSHDVALPDEVAGVTVQVTTAESAGAAEARRPLLPSDAPGGPTRRYPASAVWSGGMASDRPACPTSPRHAGHPGSGRPAVNSWIARWVSGDSGR